MATVVTMAIVALGCYAVGTYYRLHEQTPVALLWYVNGSVWAVGALTVRAIA